MNDTLTPSQRSQRMRLIRSKNTTPELQVRRMIHALGFRYSLHRKDLPGKPDIVCSRLNCVIFVHGCFWHRHAASRCRLARLPKSRLDFWLPKLESNRLRDQKNLRGVRSRGWKILVVWECELRDKERIENKIRRFLEVSDAGS